MTIKNVYDLPGTKHVVVESEQSFLGYEVTICRGSNCISFTPNIGENCATAFKCSMDVSGNGPITINTVKLNEAPAQNLPSTTQTTIGSSTPSCTDSDGKDFNTQGKVSGTDKAGMSFGFIDTCLGTTMLNEYICMGVEPNFINLECNCADGACKEKVNMFTPKTTLPANTPSCTDSDGGINYYHKGTAIEVSETGKVHEEHDLCTDRIYDMKYPDRAETLVEVYCDQNKIRYKNIKCLCIDGQCVDIKKNPEPGPSLAGPIQKTEGGSCTDTDGDNPKTHGTATETKADGSSKTHKDMCHDPHTLYESICKGKVVDFVSYDCDCQENHCVTPIEVQPQGKGSCTDSDGGFEPYTTGFTEGTLDDGTPFKQQDECFYDEWKFVGEPLQKKEYLIEQVCNGDKPSEMEFSLCTNCADGACQKAPQQPSTTSTQPTPPVQPPVQSVTPKNSNFKNDISTPLHEMSEEQLKQVSDLKIGIPNTGSVKFLEDIDARGIDFDNAVKISQGSVTVDVAAVPQLNKPAILTIENLNLKNPSLLADGSVCSQCTDVSYKDGTLMFQVTHFTTFTAVEAGGKKGTLMVGGQSYTFFVNTDNNKIVVDQNADGTLDSSSVDIHVAGNGELELGAAGGTVDIVLRTAKRYLENQTEDETTTIRTAVSGSAAGITLPNLNTTYNKAAKTQEGMTHYGALFVLESKDTHNDLTITYPSSQRVADVRVVMR